MAANVGSSGGGIAGGSAMNTATVYNMPVNLGGCSAGGKYGELICAKVDAGLDRVDAGLDRVDAASGFTRRSLEVARYNG